MKTLAHISRAIKRAIALSKTTGKHVDWTVIAKRHLMRYARARHMKIEVSGPHGICARLTIWRSDKSFKRVKSFNLEPDFCAASRATKDAWGFCTRDYSQSTGRYGPQTIGGLNDLNHPSRDLAPSTTLASLFRALN